MVWDVGQLSSEERLERGRGTEMTPSVRMFVEFRKFYRIPGATVLRRICIQHPAVDTLRACAVL